MSLAYSNVLATVAVAALPIVGGIWVAPKFTTTVRRYFFALTLWGIPFVIGQYAQEDKWGPIWVQYHLLDLSYAPWGTALVMYLLFIGATWFGKRMTIEMLFTSSFAVILAFGYASEVWDTAWAWYDGQPLIQAIDVGDYVTITVGGAVTAVLYLWSRQKTPVVVMS